MGKVFRQGEHICSIYESEDEQIATAAEYLADGLRAGERAFYVAESPAALTLFDRMLKEVESDPASAIDRRALIDRRRRWCISCRQLQQPREIVPTRER
jgi:hypothetical protein